MFREIVEQYIHLDRPNARGWHPVLCKVCNDHGKKGKRAGFVFSENGGSFNCFNCGHAAVYNPSLSRNPSDKMVVVLNAFGVPETEWMKVSLDALVHDYQPIITEIKKSEPLEITLFPFFYPLIDDPTDDWCLYAIEYLTNRGINWKDHKFYCVKKTTHPDNKRWYG